MTTTFKRPDPIEPTQYRFRWVPATLLNSWQRFSTSDAVPAYTKTPDGFVRFRGNLNGGASGTAVFFLPAGFRPAENRHMSVAAPNGGVFANAIMRVMSNGEVAFFYDAGTTWVSMDGVLVDTQP